MQNSAITTFIANLSREALWIIDIDSTLVLTHKRNEAVLRKFATDVDAQKKHPEFCQRLSSIECHAMEYGYAQALNRAGLNENQAACDDLAVYWRENFFSNTFLHNDLVHKDALTFVRALQERRWSFAYLTARPHELMYEGTLRTMEDFGFPVTRENLFLKPRSDDRDEEFKSKLIGQWLDHGLGSKRHPAFVLVDNEPKVLNRIDRDHPSVLQIFMETCHSPNVTAPSKALRVRDFTELTSVVRASS